MTRKKGGGRKPTLKERVEQRAEIRIKVLETRIRFQIEEIRIAEARVKKLEDAERACKAANESHRKTVAELEAELAAETKAHRLDIDVAEARVKELEGIPERDCGCDGEGCGCCREEDE